MISLTVLQVIRWGFLLGFLFLVGVGMWAIVTITRMRREQAIAITMLEILAASSGLRGDQHTPERANGDAGDVP